MGLAEELQGLAALRWDRLPPALPSHGGCSCMAVGKRGGGGANNGYFFLFGELCVLYSQNRHV